jgi:hypothetical protein
MFGWLKPKNKNKEKQIAVAEKPSREAIIHEATANAQKARDAIGVETLELLAKLITEKRAQEEVSPAAQARKILEHMDKGHIADFLKVLHDEKPPTKH